jgi:hypothetical protein
MVAAIFIVAATCMVAANFLVACGGKSLLPITPHFTRTVIARRRGANRIDGK